MKSDSDNTIYINSVLKEWSEYPSNLKIHNLFIGGGTPNFLHSNEIERLIKSLPLSEDSQITIEIDPRFISIEELNIYHKIGIKRLSIGIQDFNSDVLKNVNREQDNDKIIDLINEAKKINFEHINLDFIYGLNLQSPASFKQTMSMLSEVNTDSVSLYPFAKVPWQNNFQKAFGIVKDFTIHELNELFVEASFMLEEIGFKHIGMGYFSKKSEKIQRNIMGFTPRKENTLIGLGVSSISSSPIGHLQNEKVYDRYLGQIKVGHALSMKSHLISTEEFSRQSFFEKVICEKIISNEDYKNFKTVNTEALIASLLKDEILTHTNEGLKVTEMGIYFLKTILQAFDPYFNIKS
jgi:oxygen-independent coproporphyrinogen-3 oxidase